MRERRREIGGDPRAQNLATVYVDIDVIDGLFFCK